MKNYKLNFCLVILFLTMIVGCNDDEFLTEEPKTFFTADNIFTTPLQVDQVILTLYAQLRFFRTENIHIKGQGTDVSDAPLFRINDQNVSFGDYTILSAESPQYEDIFNFYYNLISVANTAISAANLESIVFNTEDEKAYIIAQAKFFRAYAHGSLAELFGGVAIVKEISTVARFDFKRETRADVYQFAINELEAIISDLPEITNQPGRLVKGVAQHFLSEFYLALGTETGDVSYFQKSIDFSSDVIDNSVYSLMTARFGTRSQEPGKDVWWDLFQKGNINYADGNLESIWTYQVDFDAFLAGDTQSRLRYPRLNMPVWRAIPGVTGIAEDVGGRGVAIVAPTPLVKDLAWEGPMGVNDQRNAEHNIRRIILYNDPNVVDASLIGTQVPQSVIDAADIGREWIWPILNKLTTDEFLGLDVGENRSNIFRDEYAIRLPETILLRAEAYFRLGQNQLAANDINLIRSRATAPFVLAADVDIDFILDERARELYVEEARWNTLLRMGGTIAVDRIRTYALNDITRQTLTFDYNLWPIPQEFIDRNKDVKWEQNPGW